MEMCPVQFPGLSLCPQTKESHEPETPCSSRLLSWLPGLLSSLILLPLLCCVVPRSFSSLQLFSGKPFLLAPIGTSAFLSASDWAHSSPAAFLAFGTAVAPSSVSSLCSLRASVEAPTTLGCIWVFSGHGLKFF